MRSSDGKREPPELKKNDLINYFLLILKFHL